MAKKIHKIAIEAGLISDGFFLLDLNKVSFIGELYCRTNFDGDKKPDRFNVLVEGNEMTFHNASIEQWQLFKAALFHARANTVKSAEEQEKKLSIYNDKIQGQLCSKN